MNVHSGLIYNSSKVETTEMFITWWMDKLWVSHTMEFYSTRKGNEMLISYMDNLENVLNWTKPVTKGYISEWSVLNRQIRRFVVAWSWGRGGRQVQWEMSVSVRFLVGEWQRSSVDCGDGGMTARIRPRPFSCTSNEWVIYLYHVNYFSIKLVVFFF